MANVKTYKMEPETSEKLQKICEELHLTWDGTFQTLANLYAQQKAVGKLPERGMEVKEFQSLLNRVSEAFTYALTVNADAEDRIRQEFAQKFSAQQQELHPRRAAADGDLDVHGTRLSRMQHAEGRFELGKLAVK